MINFIMSLNPCVPTGMDAKKEKTSKTIFEISSQTPNDAVLLFGEREENKTIFDIHKFKTLFSLFQIFLELF